MDEKKKRGEFCDVWYAIRTFYCKEEAVGQFLVEKGLDCFIPMRYVKQSLPDGQFQRKLVPAVHNLLFVLKTASEQEIREIINQCPIPVSVICRERTDSYYEIRGSEMLELRAICDPNYQGTLFVDVSVAEARVGQKVRVIHGAFKGLQGKLVRYKNRSYVVIVLLTLGVMVHIPKWYCEKIM